MPPKVNPSHKCRNADQRKKGRGRGGKKKHSPFPIPHKAPPIHTALFSALPQESVTRWRCFIFKTQITRSERAVIRSGGKKADSRACSAFSLQPETNLFGKLRAVQKETTHTVSRALNCWGQAGRQTHTRIYTHTHAHSRTLAQNGGFDENFPLPRKLLMNLITTFLLSAVTVTPGTSCVRASDEDFFLLQGETVCVVVNQCNSIILWFPLWFLPQPEP